MKIVKNFIRKVLGAKIYVWIVVAILAIFFVVAKTYNILLGTSKGKMLQMNRPKSILESLT